MKLRRFVAVVAFAAAMSPTAAMALGFHATHTVDGVDVWAVGDAGVIYRSLDAGLNWTQSTLGDEALRGVSAVGLTSIVVSDSGKIWRSPDSGGGWALTIVTGAPHLYAVAMPTASVAYVAGAAGKILKSVNGGVSWTPQTSGTGLALRALRFTDDQTGWAVGDDGIVLRTTNGGALWSTVSIGASRDLFAVDQFGVNVWIVGEDGSAFKSVNSGSIWTPVDLQLDDLADVRAVHLSSNTLYFLAGGGGFIRRSTDGGATWDFMLHSMHAPITALGFSGANVFASNSSNRVVMSSSDNGGTWSLPAGATLNRSWIQKLGPGGIGQVRGGTLQNHPTNKHAFYCAIANQVFASYNDGETWALTGRILPLGVSGRTNAFLVSPKDTNLWVAAGYDSASVARIVRTTDRGNTWSNTTTSALGVGQIGAYGIPLEMHPDKPDTIYFGGEAATSGTPATPLLRSTDFGATWSTLSVTAFRSPCDIVVVPGNSNVIHVADGITASGLAKIWRSTDGGVNFTDVFTMPTGSGNSEVPGMASSRLRNTHNFATAWSGGGLRRSTNSGASYAQVSALASAWGVDVSKDDPNVVIFGVYTGNVARLSLDGGATFAEFDSLFGANYTFYARDRATILAEQSTGVFKMGVSYAYSPSAGSQNLAVTSPNGGESWVGGSSHAVTWTAANVAAARIEYRKQPGDPWQVVADVPGYQQTHLWTLPMDMTSQAKVRVRDLWDSAPTDSSNAVFSITGTPTVEVLDPDGGEVWSYGSTHDILWSSAFVSLVDLEYETTSGGGWNPIALNVPATPAAYAWSIPIAPSTDARVRVRQSGGGTLDVSAAPFTIAVPLLEVADDPNQMGPTPVGVVLSDTLRLENAGTATLSVSSVTVSRPEFWVGRTALAIPAGSDDTLGVFYKNTVASTDTATVTIVANDPASPRQVTVIARAITNLDVDERTPTSFALWQNQPNPFARQTLIRFALPVESQVSLEVFDVQGHRVATLAREVRGAGMHAIPFGRGATDVGGQRLSRLGAGVYFMRFQAGSFAATRKMLLLN